MSPALKELVISSGLVLANSNITLTNNTDKDLRGSISVVDFRDLSDSGGLSFGQAGLPVDKYGLANWVQLPNGNNLTLSKGQAVTIPVVVDNRSDLAPGGHYGAVVITLAGATDPKGNKVNFKQELVSLLFVKKLGGEQYGLKLQTLTTQGGGRPTSVSMTFASTGNVHVVPRGFVTLSDSKGKVISKGIINPQSTMILPGTTHRFTVPLSTVSTSHLPGGYKLTAYYRYDGQPDFNTKSIEINRWNLVLVVLIVIALTGVSLVSPLLYIRRRRR